MSLVELLVTLVIASGLVIALGALVGFGLGARERVERAEAIQDGLLDLKVAAQILDRLMPVDANLTVVSGQSTIDVTATTIDGNPLSFAVSSEADQFSIAAPFGRQIGPIAIDQFESAALQFLAIDGGRPRWLDATGGAGQRLVAMRLLLAGQGRQWPVMLWFSRRAITP